MCNILWDARSACVGTLQEAILGDIRQKPLQTIWNDTPFLAFRAAMHGKRWKELLDSGIRCFRCNWLFALKSQSMENLCLVNRRHLPAADAGLPNGIAATSRDHLTLGLRQYLRGEITAALTSLTFAEIAAEDGDVRERATIWLGKVRDVLRMRARLDRWERALQATWGRASRRPMFPAIILPMPNAMSSGVGTHHLDQTRFSKNGDLALWMSPASLDRSPKPGCSVSFWTGRRPRCWPIVWACSTRRAYRANDLFDRCPGASGCGRPRHRTAPQCKTAIEPAANFDLLAARYPGARGVRSHGLETSGLFQAHCADKGIHYTSIYLHFLQTGHPPVDHALHGLWELPIFFSRCHGLAFSGNPWLWPTAAALLQGDGLKCFLLSSRPCLHQFVWIRPLRPGQGRLPRSGAARRHRRSGPGVRQLFQELVTVLGTWRSQLAPVMQALREDTVC